MICPGIKRLDCRRRFKRTPNPCAATLQGRGSIAVCQKSIGQISRDRRLFARDIVGLFPPQYPRTTGGKPDSPSGAATSNGQAEILSAAGQRPQN